MKTPSLDTVRRPMHRHRLAAVVVGVFIVGLGSGFLGGWLGARYNASKTPSVAAQKQVLSSESNLISTIAKEVGPSVVSVNVTAKSTIETVFGSLSGGSQESAGTGFVVSSNIIVTNRHVVPVGTTKVSIVLSDGTTLDNVSVLGRTGESDPLDVAFLKVNDTKGKKLQPVRLGDSSTMQVGDKVIAIGNALGQFQNTVTSGIISGYGRDLQAGDGSGGSTEQLQDLFQTDAAINQGNSGGPLVNMNGEVIGINTAVAGDAQNIGFSIPIADVNGLIKSVLASGKLERPYLGLHYVSITDDYATANDLSVKRGAYVSRQDGGVVAGSPAEKAGIQPGDILTKVNDTTIDETHSLSTILARLNVGQKVTITIVRDGKTQTLTATLGAAPQS